MRKSRFTTEQIIAILKEATYGGLEVNEAEPSVSALRGGARAGEQRSRVYLVISPASRRLRRVALKTSSKGGSVAICCPSRTDQSFL